MTNTTTPAPIDAADWPSMIEKAQREYVAEHTIELTEEEFALAKANALVTIQRNGLHATESRLVKNAQASVRAVANGSGRRRPLSRFDLIRVWSTPLFAALVTGLALLSIRELRDVVSTAQYPSWLPSEVTDALPRDMDWFWGNIVELGVFMTIVAVLTAAAATWRTNFYRIAHKTGTAVNLFMTVILVALLAAATMWAVGMTNLAGAGGGQ